MCARGGKKLGKRRSVLTSPRNRTTKPMKLQMRYLGEASSCCLYQHVSAIPAPADWVSSVSSGSEHIIDLLDSFNIFQYAASPCSVYFSNRMLGELFAPQYTKFFAPEAWVKHVGVWVKQMESPNPSS